MIVEAIKQALEALIDLTNEMIDQDFVNQGMDAITSLRQAIEQYEKQKPIAWFWFDALEDEWKHLADNQADADKYLPNKLYPLYTTPLNPMDSIKSSNTLDAQPQREWVGLTDGEWVNIVNKNQAWFGMQPDDVAHEVCKLTEAKLKEKNT